ncbi:MAG: PhoH family protein [Hyphomonadaceae bacterium]
MIHADKTNADTAIARAASADSQPHETTTREIDIQLPPAFLRREFVERRLIAERLETLLAPYRVDIRPHPASVRVSGPRLAVALARMAIEAVAARGASLAVEEFDALATGIIEHGLAHDLAFRLPGLPRPVRTLTVAQAAFMEDLLKPRNDFVVGAGPTGTGKTHIALAAGLNLLNTETVRKLVVTRPYVLPEGEEMTARKRADTERLGQFEPIEDELIEIVGHEEAERLKAFEKIELIPVGRMRGRTFNDAFVLIDEAQNMTVRTLRMVTTRVGLNSRLVVTGDPDDVDLRTDEPSGLAHLLGLLKHSDIAVVHAFETQQIVRSGLTASIEALFASAPGERPRPAARDAA